MNWSIGASGGDSSGTSGIASDNGRGGKGRINSLGRESDRICGNR